MKVLSQPSILFLLTTFWYVHGNLWLVLETLRCSPFPLPPFLVLPHLLLVFPERPKRSFLSIVWCYTFSQLWSSLGPNSYPEVYSKCGMIDVMILPPNSRECISVRSIENFWLLSALYCPKNDVEKVRNGFCYSALLSKLKNYLPRFLAFLVICSSWYVLLL